MTTHTRWLLSCVRKYSVPAFLFIYLAAKLLAGALLGDAPQPQVPPRGYRVHSREVVLRWHRPVAGTEYRLVVHEAGGDGKPVVDTKVRSYSYTLRNLEPGKTYVWKVVNERTGRESDTSFFETSRYLMDI